MEKLDQRDDEDYQQEEDAPIVGDSVEDMVSGAYRKGDEEVPEMVEIESLKDESMGDSNDDQDANFEFDSSDLDEEIDYISEDDLEEASLGGYSAEEIMAERQLMEQVNHGIVQVEEAAAEGVDYWLHLGRLQLESHRLFGAKKSIGKAQRELNNLGTSVLDLRRSLALLQKLLTAKSAGDNEIELVLRRLRNATGAAEMGDVELAAEQVEALIGDLAGGDMSNLNPFLFRTFWVGVETRWPAGGDHGVMLVRLINDGDRDLPAMRLAAPTPDYWRSEPENVDLPVLPPGAYVHLKFNIYPDSGFGRDIAPLSRKLSIISGYAVRQGQVRCTVRIQNRSMDPVRDVVIMPWMPPSFVAPNVPLIERLGPDEVTNIHIPMVIEYTPPGGDA